MQGRLSDAPPNVIQHFPLDNWQSEFSLLSRLGLDGIEWTIDLDTFHQHPLVDSTFYDIPHLVLDQYTPSPNKKVTCDFFMQLNIFSSLPKKLNEFESLLRELLESNKLGKNTILVIPLVDAGAPNNEGAWNSILDFLVGIESAFRIREIVFAFEFQESPLFQKKILDKLSSDRFMLNFDMGNSASLGHIPQVEIPLLREYIANVHIKDRSRNGPTVPLGQGSVDFETVSNQLNEMNYSANLTLQGARQSDRDPCDVISDYVQFVHKVGLL